MIRRFSSILFIAWGIPCLMVAGDCKDILKVDHAIRNARTLDGKMVCIQGALRMAVDPSKTGVFVNELIPEAGIRSRPRRDVIGVMEGSSDASVGADQYKPESFRLLDLLGANPPPMVNVVLRGTIMYEKDLLRKLAARLPADLLYDPFRGLSYSVEFVLFEVVSVARTRTR